MHLKTLAVRMDRKGYNWLSANAETAPSAIEGFGTFARAKIAEGEPVAAFGGSVLTRPQWLMLPEEVRRRSLAISDYLELTPKSKEELGEGDFVNHSCDPNAGIKGQIFLVAMRDIEKGEEITIDYAMVIADPGFRIACKCSSKSCRRIITGNDWKKRELQAKYRGFFSLYIQNKIDPREKKAVGSLHGK